VSWASARDPSQWKLIATGDKWKASWDYPDSAKRINPHLTSVDAEISMADGTTECTEVILFLD
jgi:hypothetical protein